MKKTLAIALALVMSVAIFAACAPSPAPATPAPAAPAANAPAADTPATDAGDGEELYISIISKGFQHQFWQAVYAGARAAAEEYGVSIFFDGPESEADIDVQVNMLNQQLALNPDAIALAALSTDAVLSQLQQAYDSGIPVVGFDSGVPDAPAGQVLANASTDNDAAAALGAEGMFPAIQDQIAAATADSPVIIAVLSQDVTSESITGRTRGFAQRMLTLAGGVNDSVAITGGFGAINTGDADAAVRIEVIVGATPSIVDMTSAANGILTMPGLAGVFASNEGAANGILAAINAGASVPEDVRIVGFDAGTVQKAAVQAGIFMGAITQDPFHIGYYSVSLAVRAVRGESISDVDTGARWWDASNMNDPDIALLLYD
ncbi:MAG: substrate-binding domain-containing protein [Oscillospiraceae bacterium]|nr:substrate-binding domain-containing protein [Oscillospiraceae bacterium]